MTYLDLAETEYPSLNWEGVCPYMIGYAEYEDRLCKGDVHCSFYDCWDKEISDFGKLLELNCKKQERFMQAISKALTEKQPKAEEIHYKDIVTVADVDETYPLFSDWSGIEQYLPHFVLNILPETNTKYVVCAIKEESDRKPIAIIQNPKTTQVFAIAVTGLQKESK